jgi:toxin ParE1/3/4
VQPRVAALQPTAVDSLAPTIADRFDTGLPDHGPGASFPFMAKRASDLEQLRQLPVAERLQLVEDLWDTIADEASDEALPLSPDLAAELDRRLAEHEANPRAARPWAEVRADVLAGRRRTS